VSSLYRLIFLGDTAPDRITQIQQLLTQSLQAFELNIDREVELLINPEQITPNNLIATAAIFFGKNITATQHLKTLLQNNTPILPIVSSLQNVSQEIPLELRLINCLPDGNPERIVTALLECVGLLPHQRRIFLSYRRDESRQAALQLFEELSARIFDVFLDTHSIAPAADFQSTLWQRLCDSDLLLMLDTPNYFDSRWTSAEYGRALAKGIPILRIGWPNLTPSPRTATASPYELQNQELDVTTGQLSQEAIDNICLQLEKQRSKGIAVRRRSLASNLRTDIEKIGGRISGTGFNHTTYIQLADGQEIVAHPTLGLPTAITLQNVMERSPDRSNIIAFDPVGLEPWLGHIEWLGSQIPAVKWMNFKDISWHLADWES
jgi:TIR domain